MRGWVRHVTCQPPTYPASSSELRESRAIRQQEEHAQYEADIAVMATYISHHRTIVPFAFAISIVHVHTIEDLGLDEVRVTRFGSVENCPRLIIFAANTTISAIPTATSRGVVAAAHRLLFLPGGHVVSLARVSSGFV